MKTKEELNALKEEVETLNKKLAELSEEELAQVTGGASVPFGAPKGKGANPYSTYFDIDEANMQYEINIYPGTVTEEFEPKFGK